MNYFNLMHLKQFSTVLQHFDFLLLFYKFILFLGFINNGFVLLFFIDI